jgi:hypothetical protein
VVVVELVLAVGVVLEREAALEGELVEVMDLEEVSAEED